MSDYKEMMPSEAAYDARDLEELGDAVPDLAAEHARLKASLAGLVADVRRLMPVLGEGHVVRTLLLRACDEAERKS
jgi:hypothetical protein